MHPWMGIGIFLLGTAAGALLTAIAYRGRIQNIRAEIENQSARCQTGDHEDGSKTKAARA